MKLFVALVSIIAFGLAQKDYCSYCPNHVACVEKPVSNDKDELTSFWALLISFNVSYIGIQRKLPFGCRTIKFKAHAGVDCEFSQ